METITKWATTMTSPTILKIETSYPDEVKQGGGAAVKWIKGLNREQLHVIVQDKNLTIPLLAELARYVPVKFLKNLVNHKKMEPDIRITIFRRIFRAKTQEMKNEEKLSAYKAILNIRNITKKEIRVVNSYIGEVKKLLSKANKSNRQSAPKTVKKKSAERKDLYIAPAPKPDSNLNDIVNFLSLKRSRLIWQDSDTQIKTSEFKVKSSLLAHEYALNNEDSMSSFKILISPEDLLSFRMEIDGGLYEEEKSFTSALFMEEFHQVLKGDFSRKFIEEFLGVVDWRELLFALMLKAVSSSKENYDANFARLKFVARGYEELISNMVPALNYGKVVATHSGKALITFSASVNLKFNDLSFRYWKSEEDESFGFPMPVKKTYDHATRLNSCVVEIINLKPGARYLYGISSELDGKSFKLEPREFKIPDLPVKPPKTEYYSSSYDVSFPLGGGGERRFQQF